MIVFHIGIKGFIVVIAIYLIALFCSAVDVWTKDWRYKHFKCSKCRHKKGKKTCGHFRNSGCDCKYFSKE